MPGLSESAKEKARRHGILRMQLAAAIVVTLIAYVYANSLVVALSSLWGALTAALNEISLIRGLSRIEKKQCYQPQSVLRAVYRNSMRRFVLVIASLSIAMAVLRLPGASVLVGFVVVQVVPLMARMLMIGR